MLYIIILIVVVFLLANLKQINQYEVAVMFTMGRFTGIRGAGWRLLIPVFQTLRRVDMRTRVEDVPDQKAITRDNIPVKVNAVVYYAIIDAPKSVLNVADVTEAVSQLAQTTMRNIVGEVELDQLLSERSQISERIKISIDEVCDKWGVDVEKLELKDVSLPPDMERTIAKQAEAEREKRAVIIQSEGEVLAAQNMAQAAATLAAVPGALHLRTLQSINDISSDASNTVVFAVPLEVLRAFEGVTKMINK